MALQRGDIVIQSPFQILSPGEYSLDWILCYNAQYGDTESLAMLHKKYLPVFKKMQFQLVKLANENGLSLDIAEDYLCETYDSFLNAIYTMRFNDEKIQQYKLCWGLCICLSQYLRSKNRDIMKNSLRKNAYEIQLDDEDKKDKENHTVRGIISVESVEEEYLKKEKNNPFWEAVDRTLKKLNPVQVKIFERLHFGEKKSTIIKNLNITRKDLENNLAVIQETFQRNLTYKMKTGDIGRIRTLLSA
jgi:hypothetical protein